MRTADIYSAKAARAVCVRRRYRAASAKRVYKKACATAFSTGVQLTTAAAEPHHVQASIGVAARSIDCQVLLERTGVPCAVEMAGRRAQVTQAANGRIQASALHTNL